MKHPRAFMSICIIALPIIIAACLLVPPTPDGLQSDLPEFDPTATPTAGAPAEVYLFLEEGDNDPYCDELLSGGTQLDFSDSDQVANGPFPSQELSEDMHLCNMSGQTLNCRFFVEAEAIARYDDPNRYYNTVAQVIDTSQGISYLPTKTLNDAYGGTCTDSGLPRGQSLSYLEYSHSVLPYATEVIAGTPYPIYRPQVRYLASQLLSCNTGGLIRYDYEISCEFAATPTPTPTPTVTAGPTETPRAWISEVFRAVATPGCKNWNLRGGCGWDDQFVEIGAPNGQALPGWRIVIEDGASNEVCNYTIKADNYIFPLKAFWQDSMTTVGTPTPPAVCGQWPSNGVAVLYDAAGNEMDRRPYVNATPNASWANPDWPTPVATWEYQTPSPGTAW